MEVVRVERRLASLRGAHVFSIGHIRRGLIRRQLNLVLAELTYMTPEQVLDCMVSRNQVELVELDGSQGLLDWFHRAFQLLLQLARATLVLLFHRGHRSNLVDGDREVALVCHLY